MRNPRHAFHILIAILAIVVIGMGIWMIAEVNSGRKGTAAEIQKAEMVGRIQQAEDIDPEVKAEMVGSIQSS